MGGTKDVDDLLILELARGKSIVASAKSVGVHEKTVRRRLENPDFRQRISQCRGELVTEVTGRLTAANLRAVDVLDELLQDDASRVRATAAKMVIELSVKLRDCQEFEERLLHLEQNVEQKNAEFDPLETTYES